MYNKQTIHLYVHQSVSSIPNYPNNQGVFLEYFCLTFVVPLVERWVLFVPGSCLMSMVCLVWTSMLWQGHSVEVMMLLVVAPLLEVSQNSWHVSPPLLVYPLQTCPLT